MSGTTVCRLTAAGRSAVAVISVRGPDAETMIVDRFAATTKKPWQIGQIRYGHWTVGVKDSPSESVVLMPLASDDFEIHCHGGTAAVSRIIGSLVTSGATENQDAIVNSTEDELIREAIATLTRCTTRRNAAVALDQVRGAMRDWAEQSIGVVNHGNANIDSGGLQASVALIREQALAILDRSQIGLRLAEPYRVVLAGPPNVGKSSLVNRIVGYGRSITHDAAGTTRDVVDCDTVIEGLAIRLGDTAGIRVGGDLIEQEGIRRGKAAIAAADLVVIVVDPETACGLAEICETVTSIAPQGRSVTVLNKADQLAPSKSESIDPTLLRTIADKSIGVSDDKDGIEVLLRSIASNLRPVDPPSGAPVPVCHRQVHWLERLVETTQSNRVLHCLRSLCRGDEIDP